MCQSDTASFSSDYSLRSFPQGFQRCRHRRLWVGRVWFLDTVQQYEVPALMELSGLSNQARSIFASFKVPRAVEIRVCIKPGLIFLGVALSEDIARFFTDCIGVTAGFGGNGGDNYNARHFVMFGPSIDAVAVVLPNFGNGNRNPWVTFNPCPSTSMPCRV